MTQRHLRALLLLSLAACARPQPAGVSSDWKFVGKDRITDATNAMVVSGSPIASQVGRDILQQGGNAIDAAVAVGFALAVVHPEAGNIGGGGFLVYRTADGKVYALDYREEAPSGASRDMYLEPDGDPSDLSVTGALAAAVPGSPAGLIEMHRRFGRLPFAQVINPAITLANQGYVVDSFRFQSIGDEMSRLYLFPATRAQYLPNNAPPQPGTTLVQKDLGRTLEAIRDKGAAGFYSGKTADLIVAEMERSGGLITPRRPGQLQDLLAGPGRDSVPGRHHLLHAAGQLGRHHDGRDPQHHGGLLPPATLWICRAHASGIRGDGPGLHGPERLHGRPRLRAQPGRADALEAYAAERRATIDPKHATPAKDLKPGLTDGPSTTHYSIVDADGNAVSITTTLNNSYGSAVTVTGAGFLLNDEMDDLASAPGRPNMYGLVQGDSNAIQPGKRPLSAMTPSMVVGPDGKLMHGGGDAGRAEDHHDGLSRHQQRARSPHEPGRRRLGTAAPRPGPARRGPRGEGRISAGGAGRAQARWDTPCRRAAPAATSRRSSRPRPDGRG